jgi:hypothetical protein
MLNLLALIARILSLNVVGDGLQLTVDAGAKKGVAKGWHAHLLDLQGNRTNIPDGTVTVVRDGTSVVKIDVVIDGIPDPSKFKVVLEAP